MHSSDSEKDDNFSAERLQVQVTLHFQPFGYPLPSYQLFSLLLNQDGTAAERAFNLITLFNNMALIISGHKKAVPY
jgi:hypothetical protein